MMDESIQVKLFALSRDPLVDENDHGNDYGNSRKQQFLPHFLKI